MKLYTVNRSLIVSCKGTLSSPKYVTRGVHQGSVLRPLLYLYFMDDLPDFLLKSTVTMFADDTIITVSGERIIRTRNHSRQI